MNSTFLATLLLLVLTPSLRSGQQPPASEDRLKPLAFLLGRWSSTTEGQPGAGTGQREYAPTLNGRFIRAQNHSVYPAQEKNPKGEVHDDVGFFSFDTTRSRIILRQFHGEGFVNQYVSEPNPPIDTLVFTSEAIENIPAGWRARETYTNLGPDEFEELFELAAPGEAFTLYTRARFRRLR